METEKKTVRRAVRAEKKDARAARRAERKSAREVKRAEKKSARAIRRAERKNGGKKGWKHEVVKIFVLILVSVMIAVNIKSFIRTGGLYPAGVSGLSILLERALDAFFGLRIPYAVINVVLNLGPIYIGFRYIGKKFTLYACFVILLSSVLTEVIPGFEITNDTLLIALFGGMVSGASTGLCLLFDANTGGTDFLAVFLSERLKMDSFNIILIFNSLILLAAGILFGLDKALYSIIFQFVATQVVHLIYQKYQQATLLIVTEMPEDVARVVYSISHHGATILHGEGAYARTEKTVVYSVVSRSEASRVIQAVKELDPAAFINLMRTERITGRFYYKPEE